jgi:ABC-type transport system involved in multi-copper enzyme maturation permease subunit
MDTALRFVWKQYRFELASMIVAIGLLTVGVLIIWARLEDVRPSPACLKSWWLGAAPSNCGAALEVWSGRREEWVFWLVRALPFVAGIVLGSVLVSREIEHRTAQLGWSLSGSRRRWLAERVFPVAILLVVLLAILAFAADVYEGARMPGFDPRASLNEYGVHGLPVVMRGIALFGGAALLGAIVGRQLPALILSGALALVIGYALNGAFPFGAAARWLPEDQVPNPFTDQTIDTAWLASDGTIVPYLAVRDLAPDAGDWYDWAVEHYSRIVAVLRGEQLTEIELREALVLGGFTVLALGGAFVVVDRRRPY